MKRTYKKNDGMENSDSSETGIFQFTTPGCLCTSILLTPIEKIN